jgi:hypothetical protein
MAQAYVEGVDLTMQRERERKSSSATSPQMYVNERPQNHTNVSSSFVNGYSTSTADP